MKNMSDKKYTIAVVGALGMVGQEMLRTLQSRNFPVSQLVPMDTPENSGKQIVYNGKSYTVKAAEPENFAGIDIALFSAGAEASLQLAPEAARQGVIVIDNSSAWRMDPNCPLVVPEVNPEALDNHKGIIANPNCSTIQMVVALKPLHDAASIKRIVVSTYQAVSGSGKKAFEGLRNESTAYLEKGETIAEAYDCQIAFNCIPHIDLFQDDGYTKEEQKMIFETKKILDQSISITATCVRVPVWYGHSESINIETVNHLTADDARNLLDKAPGIKLVDDPENGIYPTPIQSNNEDLTMVGRIRNDQSIVNGLNLWVVSNNIRKGAALNAVQIAETIIKKNLLRK